MNNLILLELFGYPIYASAAVITLGILLCVLMTLVLYRKHHRSGAAVLCLAVLGFIFGVLFSRLFHWYFNAETYSSLPGALTDYSHGSFCLPGMLLGLWLAAWICRRLNLTETMGELLDAAAPGVALLIAFIRLSALFNTTCRSRILVKTTWLQFLPFATGLSDSAGNVSYRMATFFIEFLLMLAVTGMVLHFFNDKNWRRMKRGGPHTGNTARLFVLLYAAVEIVMDSTRYDSPLMHFRVISVLNQYSAFISLAQVFAAFTALGILIHLTRCSVRSNGFRWYIIPIWLGFFACLFVIGKLGEYNVQRYADYLRCYAFMSAGCIAMIALIWQLYRSCVSPRDLY
ncbi:MAG: prolipoprotein diacylglyceryl transferase [Oscillospiraceae bacterium]|nr:prolipoprotein diacylglyceryl transferase [Oscillospiraceae bacterium]